MTRSNKKPTIKDVASMAGVSIATVSYVINGKEGQRIPEETKNKIFHAINILGYAPNPHAVAIKTERAKDIILRTHNRTTSLQDLENICFLQRFTPYCISEGYTVTLSADKRAQRVPATACVCLSLKPEDFRNLAKENFVPLICVDTLLYDPVFFQVTNNYKAVAELASAHYGSDFTYVTITPNDETLKEEIKKHIPNTVFVKHIFELRDLNPHNAVVTDYCLEKFLTADKILVLRQLQENKLMAVMDCVKKAVNREATEDNAHYVTV